MRVEVTTRRIDHVPRVEIAHPAIHLRRANFFRFANQCCEDSRFMNAGRPKLLGKPMILADVFRKLMQNWRGDSISLPDRKSTRLNSSHRCISYAVFCLKKKKRKLNN